MDAISSSIVGSILHVARKSGELPTRDPKLTGRAIRIACAEWEASARSFVTPDLKESPAWVAYEMKILDLGRALDFVVRKTGIWRGKGEVLDAAADVIREPRYLRGRQSWIATLGEHGGGAYGADLAHVLADEGLAGYAMKALLRAGNGGYVAEVRSAGERGRPWVQNAARMYTASFEGGAAARRM